MSSVVFVKQLLNLAKLRQRHIQPEYVEVTNVSIQIKNCDINDFRDKNGLYK